VDGPPSYLILDLRSASESSIDRITERSSVIDYVQNRQPLSAAPEPWMITRKKLIEVALPLDAINAESARETSDPPRPPVHLAPLVGAPAAGRLPRRTVRVAGSRVGSEVLKLCEEIRSGCQTISP